MTIRDLVTQVRRLSDTYGWSTDPDLLAGIIENHGGELGRILHSGVGRSTLQHDLRGELMALLIDVARLYNRAVDGPGSMEVDLLDALREAEFRAQRTHGLT